ncbi:MAG: hypothetical protein AAFU53_13370 [Cyanobacteria bacterium J06632_3]
MNRDRTIETYRSRILAAESPITAKTLSNIATSLNLDADDLAAIQRQAASHLKKGLNYLELSCLEEAIEELTQASTLTPLSLEVLHSLSEAHHKRYAESQSHQDREQAISLAKRCIAINPDDEQAIALLNSLQPTRALTAPLKIGSTVLKLLITGFVISAVGFVVWLPLGLLENSSSNPEQIVGAEKNSAKVPTDRDKTGDAKANPSTPVGSSTPSAQNPTAQNSTEDTSEVDIPIEFDYLGIAIEPRLSRLSNYDDSSFYKLHAVLANNSDQEIDELQLKVEYLDQNGTVIAADSIKAVEDFTATIRPGDQYAFDLIKKLTPALSSLRLSVTTIDQLPAATTYAVPISVPYAWDFAKPAQLSFDLAARSENFTTNFKAYFDAEWVATNTSETAIRGLKLQVTFYDSRNKVIDTRDLYVVSTSGAPMLPNEKRPIRLFKEVSEDYSRYEVAVLEAK